MQHPNIIDTKSLAPLFLLFSILFLCLFLYWPALTGPFVFDDYPNLGALTLHDGIIDLQSALYFIFSNGSGPTGRPLSMASFLINDYAWPSTAWGFKYTNLLLHLINGLLVFWFIHTILVKHEKRNWIALIAAGLWLLHPLQASTVLYVVQRMTILSSMFILLGIIYYCKWRQSIDENCSLIEIFKLLLVLSIIGFFGLISKETALTLIFYLFVLEYFWFTKSDSKLWNLYRIIIILVPSLLVIFLLIYFSLNSEEAWARRDFNLVERLMTQSRIIVWYIYKICIPQSRDTGLFQDDWQKSNDLFDPITTVLSIAFILTLLIASYKLNTRHKIYSVGIIWFFAGHIMESTVLPLELYFEHRNYLPMLGILLIFGNLIISIKSRLFLAPVAIYTFALIFVLSAQAEIWSDKRLMSEIWGLEHPTSARAQHLRLIYAMSEGDPYKTISFIDDALTNNYDDHNLHTQKLVIECLLEKDKIDIENYIKVFSDGEMNNGVPKGLMKLRGLINSKECTKISWDDLKAITEAFLNNPYYIEPNMVASIYKELAMQHVMVGNLNGAMINIEKAFEITPSNISFPLAQATWLNSAGLKDDANQYLEIAKKVKARNIMLIPQHKKLIARVEKEING